MKKLNYLFTLLLLFIGVGGAQAQWYSAGDLYTDVPQNGDKVYLFSTYTSKFFCGGAPTVAKETDDCLMEIIQEGTTGDNLPIFVLRQVSTGLYLADLPNTLHYGYDTDDAATPLADFMTVNKADAYRTTIMPAVYEPGENKTDLRCSTEAEGDNLFVLADIEKQEGHQYYFGGYGNGPFFSPYQNSNAWMIYKSVAAMPYEVLGAFRDKLFPNGVNTADYPTGNAPGQYDQTAYDAAKAAYDAAGALLESAGEGVTKEQAEEYSAKLQAAYDALVASVKPMAPGYYLIKGHGRDESNINGWNYPLFIKNTEELAWDENTTVTFPEKLTEDHAKYIFQIEDAGDGLFTIKSFSENRYVGAVKTDGEGGHTYLADVPGKYGIAMKDFTANGATFQAFCIALNGNTDDIHCVHQAGGGRVVGWYSTSFPDAFTFTPVSEDQLKVLEDALKQEQLNRNLTRAFANASDIYNRGRVYKTDSYIQEDGYYVFDDSGIISDAAQISSNSIATNEGEKGGSPAFLIDSQGDTYYHSVWSGATVVPELVFDMGDLYQDLMFMFARRNVNGNHLSQFHLYASNDGENWADEGIYTNEYNKPGILASWTANNDTIKNGVGLVGFSLSQPYRYLRLVVTGTTNSQYSNGFLMTHMAELRLFPAEYDAEASTSFNSVSEPVRNELTAAIAAAKAELAAGAATQATIDRLNAAVAAFVAEYPAPELVDAAKEDLNAYLSRLPFVAEEAKMQIGNYPQSAKDAALAKMETIVNGMDEHNAASINEAVAAIEALKTEVAATVKMPEVGKLYFLRGATSATAANSGKGAPIYAQGNNRAAGLRFMPRKSTSTEEVVVDSIANIEHYYNYIWAVEDVDQATQTIQMINVGTGMYMRADMTETSKALLTTNHATKVKMVPYFDNASNAFSLVVGKNAAGDNLYVNTTPGGGVVTYHIAGTYTGEPTDYDPNSSLKFEEFGQLSGNDEDIYTYWPVAPNALQIVTLPFAGEVMVMENDEKLYAVDGVNLTDNTLELSEIAEGSQQVEAGQGFVLQTVPGQTHVTVMLEDREIPAHSFANIKKDGIQGIVRDIDINGDGRGLTLYSNGTSWSGRTVKGETHFNGNTGFFHGMGDTTKKGDISLILLDTDFSTGISNVETAPAANGGKIYDLSGRRVQNAQKGLYIINGKKVLVK